MKTFRIIGMSLIAVLVAICAVGCSSDDDDETSSVVIPYYSYYVETNDTLLSIIDVTVHFVGEDGIEKTEKLTQDKWLKRVMVPQLPARMKAYLTYELKEGVDVEKSYKLRLQALHHVQGIDQKGVVHTDIPVKMCTYVNGTVRAGKIKEFMEVNKNQIDYNMYEVIIDKDSKGKITVEYRNL